MYDKSFAERLDFVAEKMGGTVKACQLANITHPTLMRWRDGTSDPKISNLLAFAKAGNVSLEWLVTGVDSNANQTESESEEDEYYYIPHYQDVIASAGSGKFSDGATDADDYLAFRKDWVYANGFNASNLVAIDTDGDSMLPTIPENATVLIDKSKNVAKDGRIYVVRIEDRLYVKRVQWIPTGGLRLISDNDFYESFDIARKDLQHGNIQVYGQVVHISYDLPH